jgi:hypothetical protein
VAPRDAVDEVRAVRPPGRSEAERGPMRCRPPGRPEAERGPRLRPPNSGEARGEGESEDELTYASMDPSSLIHLARRSHRRLVASPEGAPSPCS